MRLAAAAARRLPLRVRLALYRLGPVTHLLRRALTRAAPSGVHPVRVAAGDLAGMWLLLDLQVDKDLWLGTYEPDVAAAIRHFAPPGGVAYDLGANIGYSTLLLVRAVGAAGQVFAFEPLAANVERLRAAVARNGLDPQVTIVPSAVGAVSGRAAFLVHASGSMGRLAGDIGRGDGFMGSVEVDAQSLDDFVFGLGRPAPGLVKLDLEGGEGAALRGMRRLLTESSPTLLVEVHGADAAAEVSRELDAAGYAIQRVPGGDPVERRIPIRLPKHILARPAEGHR
jgi:FkbM family methyltransferase